MKSEGPIQRYGLISRLLHWGMAILFGWQFLTIGTRVLAKDSPLDEFLWSTHKSVGLLLLVLVLLRILWAIVDTKKRPQPVSRAARAGHLLLYGLMFTIPVLALLRQFGSDRAFAPFGLPLMSGSGDHKVEWMMAPANLLHGWLGWLLLVMVVGHTFMALVHKVGPGKETALRRML